VSLEEITKRNVIAIMYLKQESARDAIPVAIAGATDDMVSLTYLFTSAGTSAAMSSPGTRTSKFFF
jgi:hypothetical protein